MGLELQFSAVRVGLESRVRAGSLALRVSLGALWLRERVTPGSLFPVLVAPAPLGLVRDALGPAPRARYDPQPPQPPHHTQEPLFQLVYEKKPFGVNADYK